MFFSRDMSILVPSCNCLHDEAQKMGAHMYGIPYNDVRVGYRVTYDRTREKADCENLFFVPKLLSSVW